MTKHKTMSSIDVGRRKRAAPKPDTIPAPVIVNAAPHAVVFTVNLPIAVCRAAAIAAEADRLPDPPLAAVAPVDVVEAVAARMCDQVPTHISHAKIVTRLTTAACEALVQRVTSVALDALAQEWPREVEAERVRHAAASERHRQEADVAGQWNRRSRPVAVLGAPGMGYGFNVLPYLLRSLEGRAMNATSAEIRGACHRTKWKHEVRDHCWLCVWYCKCLVVVVCCVCQRLICLLLFVPVVVSAFSTSRPILCYPSVRPGLVMGSSEKIF
jgi:hypothetical protein